MTDKSVFSDDEWHALTDAPLLITLALFATGEHGPISMVKEASASAHAIARPGDRGAATPLITEIATVSESKEARHEMKEHRGKSMDEALQNSLNDLAPAAAALEEAPGRRSGARRRVVRRHCEGDRIVGEDGEPGRTGRNRQDRSTLRPVSSHAQ